MHENLPRPDPETDASDDEPPILVAAVVRYTDAPDELTIYPRDATGVELMSTWITARLEDTVDLDAMR